MKTRLLRILILLGFAAVIMVVGALVRKQVQTRIADETRKLARPHIIFVTLPKFAQTTVNTVVNVPCETVKVGGVDYPVTRYRTNKKVVNYSRVRLINQSEKP